MPGKRSTVVTLTRSGGVAGIRPPPQVLDTSRLPNAVHKKLEELVEKSGFFSLPKELPEKPSAPDSFHHTLTIEHADGRKHAVTFSESVASAELRELKRIVRDQSRIA